MSVVVWVADAFMGAMLSRPGGLSLRTSWVTPGTLLLAAISAPACAVLAGLMLARGGWLAVVAAAALLLVCAGAAAVAAVGVSQRRAARR